MIERTRFYREAEQFTPLEAVIVGGGGNVSKHYLRYLQAGRDIRVSALADLHEEAAKKRAAEFGIESVSPFREVLKDPRTSLIINLTNPSAHAAVTEAALTAGKHVYSEKPLAATFREGEHLYALAQDRGLSLGCAPDTFLTPDIQRARQRIDAGELGKIRQIQGIFQGTGPDSWHPNPAVFYQKGAGPVFDMGPYYLTTLAFLFGPATDVRARSHPASRKRPFPVEVPTTVSAELQYGSIPARLSFSFDRVSDPLAFHLEIIGTHGSLAIADPNSYEDNSFSLSHHPDHDLSDHRYARGMGVEEFARAIRRGESSRMDAQLGLHVLEVMEAIHTAAESGESYHLTTGVERPELFTQI